MKRLLYQAVRFVGLSGIGWLLDFTVYIILGLFFDNLVKNDSVSCIRERSTFKWSLDSPETVCDKQTILLYLLVSMVCVMLSKINMISFVMFLCIYAIACC